MLGNTIYCMLVAMTLLHEVENVPYLVAVGYNRTRYKPRTLEAYTFPWYLYTLHYRIQLNEN